MELDDARDEFALPSADAENDELSSDDPPVDDDGSCGGWCRRMNRVPDGVRKADMYAAAGG